MAAINLGRVVGKSAYEIWLDAGNTGTVADYLAAIKGDQGDITEVISYINTQGLKVYGLITEAASGTVDWGAIV